MFQWLGVLKVVVKKRMLTLSSSSPLNGQAAELWDKDPAEFKRLVLARHKTPEQLDAEGI